MTSLACTLGVVTVLRPSVNPTTPRIQYFDVAVGQVPVSRQIHAEATRPVSANCHEALSIRPLDDRALAKVIANSLCGRSNLCFTGRILLKKGTGKRVRSHCRLQGSRLHASGEPPNGS
jgi:hypothetical protein